MHKLRLSLYNLKGSPYYSFGSLFLVPFLVFTDEKHLLEINDMMESNEEEARKALDTAEMKLLENDYNGAKIFVTKARKLYPKLDGLEQVLTITHVYICGSNGGGDESDWYGILFLDPLADDETVKRHYKKLALSLHPDKNRFHGAEGAFKLVSDAWCLLSDKAKRSAYDRTRRWKEINQKKSEWPKYEPASFFSTSASGDYANQAKERWKQWVEKSREEPAKSSSFTSASDDDKAKAAKQAQERWWKAKKNKQH